jgi:Gametolysin peptidase M11
VDLSQVPRFVRLVAVAAVAGLLGVLPVQSASAAGAVVGAAGTQTGPGQTAAGQTAATEIHGTVEQVVVDPPQEFAPVATSSAHPAVPARAAADLVVQTFVRTGGRLIRLPAALARGRHAHEAVTLTVRGDQVAAVVASATSLLAGTTTPSSTTPALIAPPVAAGTHSLVILPVYWTAPDSQTVSSLSALAEQSTRYWAQQSGGGITVSTVVKPWTRIADPGGCNADVITGRALAAAGIASPTTSHQHVMFYFPHRPDCAWAGLGSVNGSFIWDNGYALTDVVSHEFGHNLGLGHANALSCAAAGAATMPLTGTCTVVEYQDTADVMGSAAYADTGSLNTALADALGLVRTVTAAPDATTTVTLAPLADVAGIRALKIPVASGTLYVDYRPAVGRDVRRTAWAGVQVHLRPAGAYPSSQLLDLQPGSTTGPVHPQLPPHLVWVVPGIGLSVVVDDVGATATISVTPTAGDTTAPSPATAAATLTTSPSGVASVAVTWAPSNDVGTGVAAYTVHAGATLLGRAGPSATALSAVLADPGATVRVDAEDAAGNVTTGADVTPVDAGVGPEPPGTGGGGSPSPAIDTTAPGAVTLIRPTLTLTQTSRTVLLSWRAATDPESGIAGYQIVANGSVLGAVASSSVTVTGLHEGRTMLLVAAVNGAGTVGPARLATVVVDTLRPSAPPRPTLRGTTLSWSAPTDTGTALRYQVLRDGSLVATSTGRSLVISVRAGRHVWTVRALDAVGHVSPSSRLTVTRTGSAVRAVAG